MDIIKVKPYEENSIEVSELGSYYVLSFSSNKHIKVSETAKKIIEKFNGENTLDIIIDELRKDNMLISKEQLIEFVDKYLSANSLIEGASEKSNEKIKSRLWFHHKCMEGKRLKQLMNPLKIFYNKIVASIILIATLVIQIYAIFKGYYNNIATIDIYNLNSIGILIGLFSSFLFHEMGHAAAATNYGVEVGNIGIGIYLFRPVLYVDLSNSWKLSKIKRIIVDLGGVYFQIIFIFIYSLILLISNTDTWKISILLIFVSIIGNINPVLRFDGYWILTDLLGVINIDKRAFQIVRNIIRREKNLVHDVNLRKYSKVVLYIYSIVYVLFSIASLIIGFYLIVKLVLNPTVIIKSISLLFESVTYKDVGMFFNRLNNSIILVLPIIYLLLFMKSYIKIRFKNFKR